MMINDKSQGSVAPYLRRGGPLTTTLLQICCLVFFQAILKIGWQLTFSEAMGKKVDFLLCTNQLKDKLARHPTYGDQKQFSQHRIGLTVSGIDKYYSLLLTHWLTPPLSDAVNANHARKRFFHDVFFLYCGRCTPSVILWFMAWPLWIYVFVSAPNNASDSGRIFLATVSSGWVLHGSFLNSLREHSNFCTQKFHKVV